MRKLLLTTALLIGTAGYAFAAPVVGEMAPDFTGTDSKGIEHSLSDFKGKTVILEWTNHECPYVRKHYDGGNIQGLQKEATESGAVWLSIVSSAEGKQGATSPEESLAVIKDDGIMATARILDPSGEIGKAYDAKTTPHMFVINPEGTLVYAGAIDSDKSFKPDSVAGATNYVKAAWEAVAAGEAVKVSQTQPYGCSVKY